MPSAGLLLRNVCFTKIEENNTREILIFKNSEGQAVVYNQTVWLLISFSAIHA